MFVLSDGSGFKFMFQGCLSGLSFMLFARAEPRTHTCNTTSTNQMYRLLVVITGVCPWFLRAERMNPKKPVLHAPSHITCVKKVWHAILGFLWFILSRARPVPQERTTQKWNTCTWYMKCCYKRVNPSLWTVWFTLLYQHFIAVPGTTVKLTLS